MTKRQQNLIDAIDLADSEEELIAAFRAAIDEITPEHLPLISLLAKEKDDRFDDVIIREFSKDPSSRKC